jgi:uncharacterized protein YbcV (DUF1398 family)
MNVQAVVDECTEGSENGSLTFPAQLKKLVEAGVEGYYTDLRRNRRIFYLPGGDSYKTNARPVEVTIADKLDALAVAAAVKQSQAGQITYRQFCEKVMRAGCACYIVSILGRRVVYLGRTGETHVEHFPAAK